MEVATREFQQVWCADFEFSAHNGNRPEVICLVAKEAVTGETIRMLSLIHI